jgi:hypothetical protein
MAGCADIDMYVTPIVGLSVAVIRVTQRHAPAGEAPPHYNLIITTTRHLQQHLRKHSKTPSI